MAVKTRSRLHKIEKNWYGLTDDDAKNQRTSSEITIWTKQTGWFLYHYLLKTRSRIHEIEKNWNDLTGHDAKNQPDTSAKQICWFTLAISVQILIKHFESV